LDFHLSEEQRALRKLAFDIAEDHFRPRAAGVDRTEEYPCDNAEVVYQPLLRPPTR
jgi:alkylation response protein AidB-like acyl-CoA dehydrogenase